MALRHRRPAAITALALIPLVLLVAFGMSRVVAPVGLIGLLFDHPWDFGLAALIFCGASVLLMAIPAVDRAVGRRLNQAREPTPDEHEHLDPLLERAARRAGMDRDGFHLLVQDSDGINAAAGGGRLVFVTSGALRLPDEALAAVLAHELGHHRDLMPVATALVWWARLPAVPIRWAAGALRHGIDVLAAKVRFPLTLLAIPLRLIVLFVQLNLLWLVYLAEVVAAWVGRLSEFRADRHAADWGFDRPLAEVLAFEAAHAAPRTRVERLLDEHPPAEERVRRLGF